MGAQPPPECPPHQPQFCTAPRTTDGGQDHLFGGTETDWCFYGDQYTDCEGEGPSNPPQPSDQTYSDGRLTGIALNRGLAESTLVIEKLGSRPGDPDEERVYLAGQRISIRYRGGAYRVTDPGGVRAISGCRQISRTEARCKTRRLSSGVIAELGQGDDRLQAFDSVRVIASAKKGNDTLIGSGANDVLQGDSDTDRLEGGGGDDVLAAAGGVDRLFGDSGNDLLLIRDRGICTSHLFDGGAGVDTASFIRSDFGVRAELNGKAELIQQPGCFLARLRRNEALEGSNSGDVLIGNRGDNAFLGRGGPDTFIGLAGNDGVDARDGERDRLIDCGRDRDHARTDSVDPKTRSC